MHLKQISSYKLRRVYLDSICYLYKFCSKQRVQCALLRGTCPARFLLSKSVQVERLAFLLVLPVVVAVVVLGKRGVTVEDNNM